MSKKKEKTVVITARIPESIQSVYKEYCEENDLTVSEAIKQLIEREVQRIQGIYNDVYSDLVPEPVFIPYEGVLPDGERITYTSPTTFERQAHRVIDPHLQVQPLDRWDVDPLGTKSDEEVEILLKEAREIRGE